MSLIVEDGTIVDGANSYIDIAFADSYYTLRGVTEWLDLTNDQKTQSLILATDFIEAVYGSNFKGAVSTPSQPLSFPRIGVYLNNAELDDDFIPNQLKNAQVEMALKASRGKPLIADQDQKVVRERVEGAIDISYDRLDDPATKYSFVSKLLSPLVISGAGSNIKSLRIIRS